MSYAAQVVNRTGKLVLAVMLLSILAATLFYAFSLILPRHQWTVGRVPIRIIGGAAVTLLIAWARYPAARPWIIDGSAAVLGLTSATLGIAITFLIAYGLSLQIAEHTGSWDSFVYQMTNPFTLWQVVYFALIAAVPGAAGDLIVRRRRREVGRASLAGMATRFSTLGLSLSALIGLLVVVAALYRLVTWP